MRPRNLLHAIASSPPTDRRQALPGDRGGADKGMMSGFFHLLDWLYPGTCELCGKESGEAICADCLGSLERVGKPICLYCGGPVSGGQSDAFVCPACKGRGRHFIFARQALRNSEETMQLVYKLKYSHANYLAPALSRPLAALWRETPELKQGSGWALVPVPVTRRRMAKRGYNQAEELARGLSRQVGAPVINALERVETGHSSQTLLGAGERRRNAFAAIRLARRFACGKGKLPSHLVVIDDIYTTGSTAQACAKALFSAPGVKAVGALALVHTDRKKRP